MYQSLTILLQIYQETLQMHKTIISDTSWFIVLTNIGELDLLRQVYGKIITTIEIATEYGESLPDWVEIEKVNDNYKQQLLEMQVDKGEASALALALETPDSTVILDDYRARKVAEKLKINVLCY
jgi:predicted nucleic acid-binding protein